MSKSPGVHFMETKHYLDKFHQYTDQIDRRLLSQTQMAFKVGVWLQSVVLKMQKASWTNQSADALSFTESIFFSAWLSDESIRQSRLSYNIHALKLRQLAGYSIRSREFAEAFRLRFRAFEKQWPNVSVAYGPLTLMEGWIKIDLDNFETEILDLAHKFLGIQFMIDDLLNERRKKNI